MTDHVCKLAAYVDSYNGMNFVYESEPTAIQPMRIYTIFNYCPDCGKSLKEKQNDRQESVPGGCRLR